MTNNAEEREIAQAQKGFDAFMNEEVTESEQFGYPVKFTRKKLYMRVLDFLEKGALFGLYLAGYRAGRWFENSHPDAAPRIINHEVNMRTLVDKSGGKFAAGMLVFSERTLENYSRTLLQVVSGRYGVKLETGASNVSTEPSVDALVNERIMAFTEEIMGSGASQARVPDDKREAFARHLWMVDQKRTHDGQVLGKWEHVSKAYKFQLFEKADTFLAFFNAMELMVKPYEPPVKPTHAHSDSICAE
jgi:hypothetical protein